MIAQRPRQRLYLVTPELADTAAFIRDLGAILQAGDIAAILLSLAAADEPTLINRAKTIAAALARHDVALLIDGHADIAARAGADGAHLTGIDALKTAITSLKPDRIAGAGGLRSRHDAMLAGEAGADYVMFGEPNRHGARPPFDALEERIAWWAGLFEIPCVGYAAHLDEVGALAQVDADFVALGDWIWTSEGTPAAAIAAAAERLAQNAAPA
jgi:thiamine-phosphate pyrophosphorylase